jgi:hypothetical protein
LRKTRLVSLIRRPTGMEFRSERADFMKRFQLDERGAETKLIFDHTGFPQDRAPLLAPGWWSHYGEPRRSIWDAAANGLGRSDRCAKNRFFGPLEARNRIPV